MLTARSLSYANRCWSDSCCSANLPEIGLEFAKPFPHFWRVAFPPADWSPRSPEAKRFDSGGAVPTLVKK